MANVEPTPPPRRRRRQAPVPWVWLGLGVIIAAALVVGLLLLSSWLIRRTPEPAAVAPTIIRLTAPPQPTVTPSGDSSTPSPVPTFTPIPTPDVAIPPDEVLPGFYAEVANTDGLGVTVRGGPSTSNIALTVAPEGTLLFILNGPEEGEQFQWWQVRLDDGTEGWVAGDFLEPAAAP